MKIRLLLVLTVAAIAIAAASTELNAQTLSLSPTQGEAGSGISPFPFLTACHNIHLWQQTRQSVSDLGVGAHSLAQHAASNPSDVSSCFAKMNAEGLDLHLAGAAIKEWCTTGQSCYDQQVGQWNSLIGLGANFKVYKMDEPVTMVLKRPEWDKTGLPRDYNYPFNKQLTSFSSCDRISPIQSSSCRKATRRSVAHSCGRSSSI